MPTLPDSVTKRDILWAAHKTPPDYGRYGAEFLAEGRLHDAAEFFGRAKDIAKLKEVLKAGLREGDAGLIARLAVIQPDIVDLTTWRECAVEAERLQKWSFARTAWEKAGDAAKSAAARDRVLTALGYTIAKVVPNEIGPAGNSPAPQA
ncbi:MAG: hypothetical protein K8T20_06285 [Planctomycetes bacterium]|nr:hypothetical protein [Planctomycetota bacterium]